MPHVFDTFDHVEHGAMYAWAWHQIPQTEPYPINNDQQRMTVMAARGKEPATDHTIRAAWLMLDQDERDHWRSVAQRVLDAYTTQLRNVVVERQ